MAEMKKIRFLSVRERHDKPHLVLSIFLWVIFLSSPLSGLLNPGKDLNVTERHFHDNPQGFFTFFVLVPDTNFQKDTTRIDTTTHEVNETTTDSTSKYPSIQKNINLIIW
jgi:hypothetical protein